MIPQTTVDPAPARLEQAARQRLSPGRLAELLDQGRRLQAAHDDPVSFAKLTNPAWEAARHLITARLPTARGAGRTRRLITHSA